MADPVTLDYLRPSTLSGDVMQLQTAMGLSPPGRIAHPRFFGGLPHPPR
ncbi:hypothetical protein [Aestuariimicrobium ganziense]|nr:hypothetical protein [Aestuariimicrobium ganziense]